MKPYKQHELRDEGQVACLEIDVNFNQNVSPQLVYVSQPVSLQCNRFQFHDLPIPYLCRRSVLGPIHPLSGEFIFRRDASTFRSPRWSVRISDVAAALELNTTEAYARTRRAVPAGLFVSKETFLASLMKMRNSMHTTASRPD